MLTQKQIKPYQNLTKKIRRQILEMVYTTQSPHLGSSFSMVEILIALYFKYLKISPAQSQNKNRDRFILSKGHGCPALYAVLSQRGFIKKQTLAGFAINNGSLEQHPRKNISQGIEVSTGSLGHGLSIGAGLALAAKNDALSYRTFVLLGDGELNEGSNWEAAMFAAHHQLDNLTAIVDYNKLQIFGRTHQVMKLTPLADKWRAFGWTVQEINGHNFRQIFSVLEKIPFRKNKPNVIIAHTLKACGVSFMQNRCAWHSRCPNEQEYFKALVELK